MYKLLLLSLVLILALPCSAKTGKPVQGFKIISMDDNSIYTQLGFQKNDAITKINGKKVKSSSDLTQITNALKTPGRIEIELIRKGKIEKMTYEIK